LVSLSYPASETTQGEYHINQKYSAVMFASRTVPHSVATRDEYHIYPKA